MKYLVAIIVLLIASVATAEGDKAAPTASPKEPTVDQSPMSFPVTEQMKEFDTNGDGRLDQQEIMAGRKELASRRPKKFPHKQFDTDGDGKLSAEEREVMQAFKQKIATKRKAERMARRKQFDKDGDGELNEEERVAERKDRLARDLAIYDKDKDGKLSREEIQLKRQERLAELNSFTPPQKDAAPEEEATTKSTQP